MSSNNFALPPKLYDCGIINGRGVSAPMLSAVQMTGDACRKIANQPHPESSAQTPTKLIDPASASLNIAADKLEATQL